MKRNSLISKLIAVLIVVLSIGLILLGTVLNSWFKNYYFEFRRTEVDNQSYSIITSASSWFTIQEDNKLNELKNTMGIINSSIKGQIYISNANGDILAESNSESKKIEDARIDISKDNMDLLLEGKTVYFEDGEEVYRYGRPIFVNNYFAGIVVIDTPAAEIDIVLNKAKKIIWTFVFITIVSTATIVGVFTRKFVVNPINQINRIANKLARGEVENRVRVKNFDEIGELARSFNVMAEYLERVDANRRDFISNVSHELRSPITSIKGFIAGILDGIIPRDKENYYLNIVYDEINRLSRLVNDLLDISAMDDGKYSLNMVELDINVLIKLCVVNAESNFSKKSLNFEVCFGNDYNIVYADRDRVMQVITNLLDNAIKYSYDGGNIKISTKDKGDKVYVKVRNEGPTLTKDELVQIWDRFYKADKSRTNKESTGLGLSIVKLILTQHGEEVWAKNEKDGVSFTFTLSKEK